MAAKSRELLSRFIAGEDVSLDDPSIKEVVRGDADDARQFTAGELGADELDLHPDVAEALIDALVDTQNAERLAELAARGDKSIVKEARRGVHLLKTRGVEVAVEKGPAKKLTAAVEAPEAWAAPPDGAGERLVALITPALGRGFNVIYVHVSDQMGLVDVVASQGPKKLWRNLKKRFDDKRLLFAPVEPWFAARIAEEGYARTVAVRRAAPRQWSQICSIVAGLRRPDEPKEHPALREVPEVPVPNAEQARALHDIAELRGWAISRDAIRELSRKFEEVSASTVLIDDRQRVDARRRAMDDALAATFDETGRKLWARRLLDAAYVYNRGGQRAAAAQLRALATHVESPGFDPLSDAFARPFVDKLVSPEILGERGAETRGASPAPQAPVADEPKLIVTP